MHEPCTPHGSALPQVFCGIEMPFLLIAKDTTGHKRTSGGNTFEVTVEDEATGAAVGSACVVDRGIGTYECFYRCVSTGMRCRAGSAG